MRRTICVLTLLILCLCITSGYAQNEDSVIISRVKWGDTDKQMIEARAELNGQKVDTIVCYYVRCIGYAQALTLDSCNSTLIKYLIWKIHGRAYIRKFDGCHISTPKSVSTKFLKTLYSRLTEFKSEKISYPEYYEIVDGKKQIFRTRIDHSCVSTFEVSKPDGLIVKEIDDYALDTQYPIKGKRNIHYLKNQRSFINKLNVMVKELIKF